MNPSAHLAAAVSHADTVANELLVAHRFSPALDNRCLCAFWNTRNDVFFHPATVPQLTAMLPPEENRRLLYVNPPRTGIELEVLDWIADVFRPSRVAFLSCKAVSLKKDLTRLTGAGYRVARIIPFDFFPGTRYLEMLALLERE